MNEWNVWTRIVIKILPVSCFGYFSFLPYNLLYCLKKLQTSSMFYSYSEIRGYGLCLYESVVNLWEEGLLKNAQTAFPFHLTDVGYLYSLKLLMMKGFKYSY
jgi:hypothetical protein